MDGEPVWDAVIRDVGWYHDDKPEALRRAVVADMRGRDAFGEGKYGTRLRCGDGRNALVDAYQEALDLVAYLKKASWETPSVAVVLAECDALRLVFTLRALLPMEDTHG